jgi:excisionase family DNA binding protein
MLTSPVRKAIVEDAGVVSGGGSMTDAPSSPSRPAPPPVLLTVRETAALLRTTPKAVYALVERGKITGVVRLGRRVLFDRARLLRGLGVLGSRSDERASGHVAE